MKKLLTAIAGILLAACLAVTLVACSTDVDGKTYVYDSMSISGEGVTDETEEMIKASMEEMFKGKEMTFKDGKVSMNGEEISYKQYGDTVILANGQRLEIDGKKLTMDLARTGLNLKVIFKQK